MSQGQPWARLAALAVECVEDLLGRPGWAEGLAQSRHSARRKRRKSFSPESAIRFDPSAYNSARRSAGSRIRAQSATPSRFSPVAYCSPSRAGRPA